MLKKYNNDSKLVNVSQTFHYYVAQCEKRLIERFDEIRYEQCIGEKLVASLLPIDVPTRCINFPKKKFLTFFVRLRIFYLLKFLNSSFKDKDKTRSQKVVKQFRHM
jgi:hypothetical protein